MEVFAKRLGYNRRQYRQLRLIVILILLAYSIDIILHSSAYRITSPTYPLDLPFSTNCSLHHQDPPLDALYNSRFNQGDDSVDARDRRENATIMILARNTDLVGVLASVRSLEKQWNNHYHYPYVFLNDMEWDLTFIESVRNVTESDLAFERIPQEMWSWPKNADGADAVDRDQAAKSWNQMQAAGLPYVTRESYHHMCRFFSGFFFDHPVMAQYRYFWRVEPDVDFSCHIPYDPFRAMRRNQKIYGYTMALWEIGSTCPSLFRTTADYKDDNSIATTSLWKSLLSSNWAPFPVRWFIMSAPSLFHSRTRYGDSWNHCHFWSNFEIADMEFFRSEQYRSYFATLDHAGGFFTERWGDAPVHSLALAMFAKPEQLHYFEDIGYSHPPFQHCPPKGVGCNCTCDPEVGTVSRYCLDRLRKGVDT